MAAQTALIVPIPIADECVGRWRRMHDPSGRAGLGAHVTLLVPFVSPAQVGASPVEALGAVFRGFEPWGTAFWEPARFPDTLVLLPKPDEPFRELTQALVARWPEHPPYEGAYADPTPHLTVAHGVSEETFDRVQRELAAVLPFRAQVKEARLVIGSNESGWSVHTTFPFGGEPVEGESAPERCPVHGDVLRPKRRRVRYGLPAFSDAYEEARTALFPHSDDPPLGGCMVGMGPAWEFVYACAACDEARARWRRDHA